MTRVVRFHLPRRARARRQRILAVLKCYREGLFQDTNARADAVRGALGLPAVIIHDKAGFRFQTVREQAAELMKEADAQA